VSTVTANAPVDGGAAQQRRRHVVHFSRGRHVDDAAPQRERRASGTVKKATATASSTR